VQLIAPIRAAEPVQVDRYALDGNQFQYPYPVTEEWFLVTLALPTPKGRLGRFNIYLIDRDGRRELLVEGDESGEGAGCRQIVPLAPRPAGHVRPDAVDYRSRTGTVFMRDVYEGPGLAGIPRGTIDRLRVVGLEFRAAGVGHAAQQGPGGGADVSTPIAVGNASWDVKVVHGSARVYPDGSACFVVPAAARACSASADANCPSVGGENTELPAWHHARAPVSAGRPPLRPRGVGAASSSARRPMGMSITTTSAICFSASRWAVVAPTLPAPTTVTLCIMAGSSILVGEWLSLTPTRGTVKLSSGAERALMGRARRRIREQRMMIGDENDGRL